MLEDEIFKRKVAQPKRLLAYGFQKNGSTYTYQQAFLQQQFIAKITVQDNQVTGQVYDADSQEPYLLLRVASQNGAYVSSVRAAYGELLTAICENCSSDQPFATPQANRLSQLVLTRFQEAVDYPFKKLPTYGVFRHAQSNKWYGLIMNIDKAKLTKLKADEGQEVEVLNLKVREDRLAGLLKLPGFYPAYHMNRANWLSILLNAGVEDELILDLLTESRNLTSQGQRQAGQKVSWLEPANPKYYDVAAAFKVSSEITWKQNTKVQAGDTVYLYMTAPIKALCYQCQVLEAGIESEEFAPKKLMRLKLIQTYPPEYCSFETLKSLGVKAIRGARKAPKSVDEYLAKFNEKRA